MLNCLKKPQNLLYSCFSEENFTKSWNLKNDKIIKYDTEIDTSF